MFNFFFGPRVHVEISTLTTLGVGTFPAAMYRLSVACVMPSFFAACRVENWVIRNI